MAALARARRLLWRASPAFEPPEMSAVVTAAPPPDPVFSLTHQHGSQAVKAGSDLIEHAVHASRMPPHGDIVAGPPVRNAVHAAIDKSAGALGERLRRN